MFSIRVSDQWDTGEIGEYLVFTTDCERWVGNGIAGGAREALTREWMRS